MTKKQGLFLVPIVLFGLLMVMLALRLGKPTDIVANTATGRDMPSFSLPLLGDGGRVFSNDDLPNHPFILNVWGSWCPTCRVEHPFLMQLSAQGVPMVGVNYKDELSDALTYLNQHGNPFLYSLQDSKGDLALDLGLMGAPESFVVDSAGQVRLHIVGELFEGNWQNEVAPCLTALNNASLSEADKNTACQGSV